MKLLNIETPVTRNFIPQILLNVQDFYFHKVGYTSYEEGIFGPYTDLIVFQYSRRSGQAQHRRCSLLLDGSERGGER
jgi:hypothetical protein